MLTFIFSGNCPNTNTYNHHMKDVLSLRITFSCLNSYMISKNVAPLKK